MGNCVLRDMGFELEKDEEKKRQMEEYLREKLAAKYPDAYRIHKAKSPEFDNNNKGPQFSAEDDDEEDLTNGRLSRMVRKKKKTRQITVQTAEDQEEKYSPSAVSNFSGVKKNIRHGHKLSSDTTESRNLGDNESPYKPGSSYTDARQGSDLSKIGTPLKGIRSNSDNSGAPNALRTSNIGGKANLFDGIERINFNGNGGRTSKFSTGRAKHPMIKGFENKYFRVSRQRSPSANEDDEKLFDDEDEEDFPYDYNN